MKKKVCPECGDEKFKEKELWLNLLFNRKLFCRKCEVRLEFNSGFLGSVFRVAIVHLAFYVAIFLGIYFRSWYVFFLMLIVVFLLDSFIFSFSKLRRVGRKQFRLDID